MHDHYHAWGFHYKNIMKRNTHILFSESYSTSEVQCKNWRRLWCHVTYNTSMSVTNSFAHWCTNQRATLSTVSLPLWAPMVCTNVQIYKWYVELCKVSRRYSWGKCRLMQNAQFRGQKLMILSLHYRITHELVGPFGSRRGNCRSCWRMLLKCFYWLCVCQSAPPPCTPQNT